MTPIPRHRHRLARRLGWLAVASLVAASFIPSTFAAEKTEITICHATGSQGNPYVVNSPAINSSGAFAGELAAGHNDHTGPLWFPGITETWGDIIPPYDYEPADFHYAGLNWTAEGQAIYNNGCNIPETTPPPSEPPPSEPPPSEPPPSEPPPSEPPPSEPPPSEPPPSEPPPSEPPPSEPPPSEPPPSSAPTPTPEGSVGGATGTPPAATTGTTLPPTDTLGDAGAAPGGDAWRLVLLALAGTLAAALLLTPAKAVRKDR